MEKTFIELKGRRQGSGDRDHRITVDLEDIGIFEDMYPGTKLFTKSGKVYDLQEEYSVIKECIKRAITIQEGLNTC